MIGWGGGGGVTGYRFQSDQEIVLLSFFLALWLHSGGQWKKIDMGGNSVSRLSWLCRTFVQLYEWVTYNGEQWRSIFGRLFKVLHPIHVRLYTRYNECIVPHFVTVNTADHLCVLQHATHTYIHTHTHTHVQHHRNQFWLLNFRMIQWRLRNCCLQVCLLDERLSYNPILTWHVYQNVKRLLVEVDPITSIIIWGIVTFSQTQAREWGKSSDKVLGVKKPPSLITDFDKLRLQYLASILGQWTSSWILSSQTNLIGGKWLPMGFNDLVFDWMKEQGIGLLCVSTRSIIDSIELIDSYLPATVYPVRLSVYLSTHSDAPKMSKCKLVLWNFTNTSHRVISQKIICCPHSWSDL